MGINGILQAFTSAQGRNRNVSSGTSDTQKVSYPGPSYYDDYEKFSDVVASSLRAQDYTGYTSDEIFHAINDAKNEIKQFEEEHKLSDVANDINAIKDDMDLFKRKVSLIQALGNKGDEECTVTDNGDGYIYYSWTNEDGKTFNGCALKNGELGKFTSINVSYEKGIDEINIMAATDKNGDIKIENYQIKQRNITADYRDNNNDGKIDDNDKREIKATSWFRTEKIEGEGLVEQEASCTFCDEDYNGTLDKIW